MGDLGRRCVSSMATRRMALLLVSFFLWAGCSGGQATLSREGAGGDLGSGGFGGGGADSASCGPGTTLCGSLCVDTAKDPTNCGTCGAACGTPTVGALTANDSRRSPTTRSGSTSSNKRISSSIYASSVSRLHGLLPDRTASSEASFVME